MFIQVRIILTFGFEGKVGLAFPSFLPHWTNLAKNTPSLIQWLDKSSINNLHLHPDFPQAPFSKQCGTATRTAKCDSLPASGPWLSACWDCWWGGAHRAAPWHVAQHEGGPLWTTTLDWKPGTVGWVDLVVLYEAAWLLEVRIRL